MPSPFPGMDPYLERPSLWPDVHHEFISQIRAKLNPQLLPNYVTQIETRVYVVRDEDPAHKQFVADVSVEKPTKTERRREPESEVLVAEPVVFPFLIEIEIEEARIEIKDRRKNTLVTVIEVLSPTNKDRRSEGRENFLANGREILAAPVHWVEIDLLRQGEPSIHPLVPPSDYRVYLSRADDRQHTRGWLFSVRQALPIIGIPLGKKDPDVSLNLGTVLNDVYDQAGYGYLVDYSRPADPPLKAADAKWARQLLRSKSLR
jgi:hypothetical protein